MRRHGPLCPRWAMAAVAALFVAVTTSCASQTPPTAPSRTSISSTARPPSTVAPSKPAAGPVKARALARSVPVRLQVAAIGVDSKLMDLGLLSDGSLQVPPSGFPAGWYTGMGTPGERGPAIIAGHVDWKGPGVFYNLHNLRPGDDITITRKDGSKPVFRVAKVAEYPKDQFPTKLVYGQLSYAALRLITCGGTFDTRTGHYEDNTVVFANLIG